MGLEKMTDVDFVILHLQFNEEPHPPYLISIEVHPILLLVKPT
jgi:hypothetical protein